MSTYLLITNCVCLFLLGFIWKKGDWLNFFLKLLFLVLAALNAFEALKVLGYIVKVGV